MDELRKIMPQVLNASLEQVVLSNTRDDNRASKVKIRPVMIKNELLFQETLYRGTQVFHENFHREEITQRIVEYMQNLFKQGEIKAFAEEITILVSKKGKMTIKRRRKQGILKSQDGMKLKISEPVKGYAKNSQIQGGLHKPGNIRAHGLHTVGGTGKQAKYAARRLLVHR